MVGHDYYGMQFDLSTILKEAVLQGNCSGRRREKHAQALERDKVCCMEFLNVRQVSSIVTLHRLRNAERKQHGGFMPNALTLSPAI